MYEHDGHTHTDRQTPHDSIGRAFKASRGKNEVKLYERNKQVRHLLYNGGS